MTVKEAIELLKRATMFEPTLENRDYPEAFDLAIKALEERPQGEWIKQNGKSYELKTNEGVFVGEFTKCPKCQYDKARGSNFCPNCGADMRGK